MSITISLCMIVKNEEDNLDACLSTVYDIVDEINIVDTGSTDKTVEIARKYTDRIFFFEWINDFSAARNFSFSKATKEYIMWLDADDVIYETDREKLKALKNSLNKKTDIVLMDYRYKKDEFGNIVINQKRERLIKRSLGLKWSGRIHEGLPLEGKIFSSDIGIDHEHNKPDVSQKRNLQILEEIIGTPEETMKDLYYYAKTLYTEGEDDKALPFFIKFVELNKTHKLPAMDAYLALYYIYLKKQDYEKAYLVLAENDSLLNNYSEYYCSLGKFSSMLLKDYELAISYYNKALKCTGADSSGEQMYTYSKYYYFTPYYALGGNYSELGKYTEAVNAYNKALEYTLNHNETEEIRNKIRDISRLI
ncbi:glycosyltransferase [Tyzzerella sp. OttesenSCG-928-J15]|nr:glycosyltransferase [Tyzzerella sp. OttesenSCG-928-J15]